MVTAVHPYLMFNGDCEKAFQRYAQIFRVQLPEEVVRFKDVPEDIKKEMNMQPKEEDRIMHICLNLGDGTCLMGSDESVNSNVNFGNNINISLGISGTEETKRVFHELAEEGTVTSPLKESFWGALYGKCKDKFGVDWAVNCQIKESKYK